MENRPVGRKKNTDSSAKGDVFKRGSGLGLGGKVGKSEGPRIPGFGQKSGIFGGRTEASEGRPASSGVFGSSFVGGLIF